MDEIFVEQIVKRKTGISVVLMRVFSIIVLIMAFLLMLMFNLGILAFTIEILLIYGEYMLWCYTSIEYEYSLVNGEFSVDDLIAQFSTFYYNKMILDITAIKGYEDINVMQNLSVNFDMSKVILLLDDSEKVNSPMYISQLISMGIYNFTNDVNTIKYLIDNPNQYKDVANYHNIGGFKKPALNERAVDNTRGKIGQKIIGIKNVTEHAGATTLIYLLKLHLEKYYKVKAVEIDKNDFIYFNDETLESTSSLNFVDFLSQNSGYDVILVDLNENPYVPF